MISNNLPFGFLYQQYSRYKFQQGYVAKTTELIWPKFIVFILQYKYLNIRLVWSPKIQNECAVAKGT